MLHKLLLLAFIALCAPAFASGPEVLDLTKEEQNKPAPENAIAQGTIKAACAPWKDGVSLGMELDNHIGITLYVSIDTLPDKIGTEFKAGGDMREAGSAVIFRCDENDTNCNQLAGTVIINEAKNPNYIGVLKIEGEKNVGFAVKRVPSTAKCDG